MEIEVDAGRHHPLISREFHFEDAVPNVNAPNNDIHVLNKIHKSTL
jgi:hypothetical protein